MDNRFSIPVAAPDCSFIVSVLHNIQHIVALDKGLGHTKRPLKRTRIRRSSIFSSDETPILFYLKMVKKRLKCFTMVPAGLEGKRGGVQNLSGKWPNRQGAFHKGTSLGC